MGKCGYLVCMNPKCTKKGGYSWRPMDKGPDNCEFCKAPFRVHKSQVSQANSAQDAWKKQNSKGRVRPAESSSPPAGAEPVPKVPIDELEAQFRKRIADTNEQVPDGFFDRLFPKKPKTSQELAMECFEAVEKAEAELQHHTKVAFEMETKYDRLCQELVDYQQKVAEQVSRLEVAKAKVQEANRELVKLKARDPPPQASEIPIPSIGPKVKQAAQNFNPTMVIAQTLAKLPAMNKLEADEANTLGTAMVDVFKQLLLTDFCNFIDAGSGSNASNDGLDDVLRQELVSDQGLGSASQPSAPTSFTPTAAAAAHGSDDGGAKMMEAQSDIKRSREELEGGSIAAPMDSGDAVGSNEEGRLEQRNQLRTKASDLAKAALNSKAALATGGGTSCS